jgi:hypothetical protein
MNENTENTDQKSNTPTTDKVDEIGGFYFSSAIKIYDPNTEEVLVQMRGDT